MKKLICSVFDHDWRFNFPSIPNKCICNRCGTKMELNLVNLEWEEVKSFNPKLGTDDELKGRWHKLEDELKSKLKESEVHPNRNTTPNDIREEMDSDMEDNGMAQGEIESCLNHWNNKYIIKRK
jgi:hypothetical protein